MSSILAKDIQQLKLDDIKPQKSTAAGDIQQLYKDIEDEKRTLAQLNKNGAKISDKAVHQKLLGDKEEELQYILEKQRVDAVVSNHEKDHTQQIETCPICLDDIKVTAPGSVTFFFCCVKGTCHECTKEVGGKLVSCPMCRAPMPNSDKQFVTLLKKAAKNGSAYAQMKLGWLYLDGTQQGIPVNYKEAFKWFKLSSFPAAFEKLAEFYFEGLKGVVKKEPMKAFELRKQAADAGLTCAQENLAHMYMLGQGIEQDWSKAVLYATLSCREGTGKLGGHLLGILYFHDDAGVFEKNLYRAKYYLEMAARNGYRDSFGYLARVLFELRKEQYDGNIAMVGYNSVPKILYCARKGAAVGHGPIANQMNSGLLKELEEQGQKSCDNCFKKANVGQKFNHCASCKSAWYCSRECQCKHWTRGHKLDCIKHNTPLEKVLGRSTYMEGRLSSLNNDPFRLSNPTLREKYNED